MTVTFKCGIFFCKCTMGPFGAFSSRHLPCWKYIHLATNPIVKANQNAPSWLLMGFAFSQFKRVVENVDVGTLWAHFLQIYTNIDTQSCKHHKAKGKSSNPASCLRRRPRNKRLSRSAHKSYLALDYMWASWGAQKVKIDKIIRLQSVQRRANRRTEWG